MYIVQWRSAQDNFLHLVFMIRALNNKYYKTIGRYAFPFVALTIKFQFPNVTLQGPKRHGRFVRRLTPRRPPGGEFQNSLLRARPFGAAGQMP